MVMVNHQWKHKKLFKDFIEYVFSEDGIKQFLTDTVMPDDRNIVNLKINHYFEVAPMNGKLHMHGLLSIKHVGNFGLKANWIQAVAKVALRHNVYFNAPVNGDSTKLFEQYAAKKQGEKEVKL